MGSVQRRLYHDVADQIVDLISSGKFPPGSRLPGERDLAESFGVSRVTVREAQIALQAKGIIEVRTGSGSHVLPERADSAALPAVGPFELTQARALFEGEAAALAATVITEGDLEHLDVLLADMADEALHAEADESFHRVIAEASGNRAVADTVRRLWRLRKELPEIRAAYDAICDVDGPKRIEEHREVVNALRARDPKLARANMREHFARITEAMLIAMEERAIQEARRRTDESRRRFLETPAAD